VRPLTVADLDAADEAFFTGTAAEVVPIVQIDDHAFAGEGELTQRLRTTYTEVVRGRRAAPGPWLTQVL
jgi:branched-chain amino acid aminotransferase